MKALLLPLLCFSFSFSFSQENNIFLSKELFAKVNENVSHYQVKKAVYCYLQEAIWGEYDLTLQINAKYCPGYKSRTFRVTNGELSVTIAENNIFQDIKSEGGGKIEVSSADEAFKRGIPFYIGDVIIELPDSVSFTIYSNPNVKIERAFLRDQSITESSPGYFITGATVRSTTPFASDKEGQNFKIEIKSTYLKDEKTKYYLSIVTAEANYSCVVSNEVLLRAPKD